LTNPAEIAALKSKDDLAKQVLQLHREGTNVLFNFSSGADFKNASQIIADLDQGGLGLHVKSTSGRAIRLQTFGAQIKEIKTDV